MDYGAILGKGAEADIYSFTAFGTEMVVKVRNPKAYRIAQIDNSIRRARTKKEARIMAHAAGIGVRVPRVFALGTFSIYMEMVKGKNANLLEEKELASRRVLGSAGEMLGMMHSSGIVHGDITPANIMVSGNGIYIIDFGLAEMSRSVEDMGVDLLLMERSVSKNGFGLFLEGYKGSNASSGNVLKRLEEIKRRGRYQNRSLD
jgi:Kae1-associated kinase Bud32